MTGKKRRIIWITASILILISALLIYEFWPRRPFANLKQEEVSSIDLTFGVNANYEISETDQEKVVTILQSITTTGKSFLYASINKELDKKTYVEEYLLHRNSGSDITVIPDYPFIIIDGTAYHCNDKEVLTEMIDLYTAYIEVIRASESPAK